MDYLKCSIKNIMRKKLRSMLTIIGIAIGVLSVVIITIIGDVGKFTINAELNSMGIGGICVRTSSELTSKTLSKNELELVQANSNVQEATPLITKLTNIKVREGYTQAIVWGIDSNAPKIVNMKILYGRHINKSDIISNSKVCVVEQSFAQNAYKRDNIVGKTVNLQIDGRYEPFKVIGVVETGGNILQGVMGNMVPSFLYVPFTSTTTLSSDQKFSQIVVKLNENVDETNATNNIVSELYQSLGISSGIRVENLNQQKDQLNSVLSMVTFILSIIGGISLVVAGLSIMTVMLVTVNERTREIGIKKSIGANKMTIMLEFLTESFLLSLIGSVIGTVVGIVLSAIGCYILSIPLIVNFKIIVFCILFSIGIGILFGVYPAVKASKLKPVDALRI